MRIRTNAALRRRKSIAAGLAATCLWAGNLADTSAQVYPAVWVGGDGSWITSTPGRWIVVDFESLWKFFPDNSDGSNFAPYR